MKKRLMALLLSGVLAVSMFAGCGAQMDKTATVATDGTTEISLGVANFAARFTQAQYDDFYQAYFGENVWRTDMYGYGTTAEDDLKGNTIQSLYAMYALKNHMADYGVEITEAEKTAISEAAAAFIAANSAEAVEALGATQEIVEEYLTLLTVEYKMYEEIIKDADTNVSDEEAKTSTYSQVYISKTSYKDEEGNSVEYTEEELTKLAETVKTFAAEAKENGLEKAAEEYDYDVTTATYNANSSVSEEIANALKAMTADGEVSDLIELESAYYVVQMDALVDADETEANRAKIISDRQAELYNEVTEGFVAASEWKLDEKLWAQVSFDNLFTVYPPVEETEGLEGTETK